MTQPTKRYVFVVILGAYEELTVDAVYDSVDAAIRDHPMPLDITADDVDRPGGWQRLAGYEDEWSNGLNYDHAVRVKRFAVKS